MPDLGILGWIIVGLIAGAVAGAFVPARQRYGCLGTMLIGILGGLLGGILGGLLGGFLWVDVLGQPPATGWLGAVIVAAVGAMIVLLIVRGFGD